jgi:molybdate transport system substrate-binding protein
MYSLIYNTRPRNEGRPWRGPLRAPAPVMRMRRAPRLVVLLCLGAATGWTRPAPAAGRGPAAGARAEISFYAATSLRDALQDLAPRCETTLGVRLVFNFGASNDLARQIVAAARADVFFSADEDWMDRVAAAGLVDAVSRRSLLSNRLVVVGARDTPLRIGRAEDLRAPAVRRIALANPEAVPAGKYAKAWLERAGAWEAIRERLVPSIDVRAALAAVESGAADVAIVYRTDAGVAKRARILYEVPDAQGPRISYAVAALGGRADLDLARRVVAWLAGPEAAATFERFGFIVPRAPA